MIRFEHVNKSFGAEKVLVDFSLHIEEGEFSDCDRPFRMWKNNDAAYDQWASDSGFRKVLVEGQDVAKADLIALRRRIGYVIQNKGLFPHMTVEENITYVPVISGKKDKQENRKLALRLLQTVGLAQEMADRYPAELSGGQQQRVGIARALAADAKILLMDEPFGALDEITKRAMQDEMLSLQKKLHMTIVFITHDIREAMKLGDRVLVMEKGRIAQIGMPQEIREYPADDFVRELTQW